MTLYFLVILGASVDVEQYFQLHFSTGLNTLMMLKIWVQIHSLGALGCSYMLSIVIIYVTYFLLDIRQCN